MTTSILVLLTLLAAAASAGAIQRLRGRLAGEGWAWLQQALTALAGLGAAGLYAWRWIADHGRWQPLAAHMDGLLLIAALLAAAIVFIQSRSRLTGLSAFALPLLTLILAWAICAWAWTYQPFNLDNLASVWKSLHLAGVYLGTLFAAVAAVAGGMYLFVCRQLKHKQPLPRLGRLASLETLENLIVRSATVGFALLSLGLAAGIITGTDGPTRFEPGWWYSPKVMLGGAAWVVFALLMNVRFASTFRGPRAAWMAIFGLVLLLATYGVATAMPHSSAWRSAVSLSHSAWTSDVLEVTPCGS